MMSNQIIKYTEAYRKARKLRAQARGSKPVVIVRNSTHNHRAYFLNDYQCKRQFFPIIVKEL